MENKEKKSAVDLERKKCCISRTQHMDRELKPRPSVAV